MRIIPEGCGAWLRAGGVGGWLLAMAAALPQVAGAQVARPPMPIAFKAPPFRATGAPVGAAPVVSGHVDKPTAKTISLSYAPDWRGHLTKTVEAKLSPTGDFRLPLPGFTTAGEARLSYQKEAADLYLTPGDNLHLAFDAAKFDQTLAFTGRGANANTYLAQTAHQAAHDDEARQTPDTQAARLSAADLRQLADAYRQRRLAILQAYAATHPLPAAFVRQQQQAIGYEWASSLLSYYSRQPEARRREGYATVPVGYYDFLPEMQLYTQDSALVRASFQSLLMTYGFTQLNGPDGNLPTGPTAGRRLYQLATDALGDGRVRDVAVGQYLLSKVEYEHADIRPLLADFRAHNHDSTIARTLRQALRAHAALMSGQPAPNFTLQDASGKSVSLSDFKGRVVYLDFWATWCAPCLAEMPASLALRQKFAGRDVVFLYVSLDSKTADWQAYVAAKHTPTPNAVQLHDAAAFNGLAAKAFGVKSIPSYWLIGRDGRLVLSSPPHPSARPASDEALEKALQP
ncbi:redoxin domain-containing protein [Hymenobacter sp. HMF4947]|uniref:Redoxin domain-containing protein n=1 Tax=Hymenobacter ginkgonis TaxID=2682976 RepID=A0A7K1TFD9_9BACT|nr:TlpA disulfide reductase family protein [Hymenobacter ginkgonis]MVN77133.1 redoxin domain-containing protein [Hymenobacter ginkgonis]